MKSTDLPAASGARIAAVPAAAGAAQRLWPWIGSIAFIAAYIALDWISYIHPVSPLGITPWNPTAGLSLFLLLRMGWSRWPLVMAAALAADVVTRGAPAQPPALFASAALIAGTYAVAAYLMRVRLRISLCLDSIRDLGSFMLVSAAASFVVAAGFVGMYTALGAVAGESFLADTVRYWIGDLNGILVLAPALLAHVRPGARLGGITRALVLEIGLQTAAIAAALWAVRAVAEIYGFNFFSLLFLPLVWIAVRWGLPGATLALAAIQLGLILVVQLAGYHLAGFVQLQFLMIALSVAALIMGCVVSQRQRIEARLQDRQAALNRALQLAAAGELTSALAHELNQPIAALGRYLGACEVLAQSPDGDRELLRETMSKAVSQARRASEVVRRLRDFYRTGATRPQRVSAASLVQSALQTVRARVEMAGVRVTIQAGAGTMDVLADPLQIETALQNLLNNAIDALDQMPREERTIDIGITANAADVVLSIQDSGPGIAAEVRPQLFEPFTTTKAEGLGMGLAISRTLVVANGGEIAVDQGASHGARFVLRLPVRAAPQIAVPVYE